MFKGLMAGLGFGGATVRLMVPGVQFRQGEPVLGRIVGEGGGTPQKADQIYLHLNITSQYEDHSGRLCYLDCAFDTLKINMPLEITGESFRAEVPFVYKVPLNCPLSRGGTGFELAAGLDVKDAINPCDRLAVKILPCIQVEAVLNALDKLKFRHRGNSGDFNGKLQQFVFSPTIFMYGQIDELALTFRVYNGSVAAAINITCKNNRQHFSLKWPDGFLVTGGKPNTDIVKTALKEFLRTAYDSLSKS